MRLRFVAMIGLLVLAASATFGHGDKKHIRGTLDKINADSVVVKTIDGKSVDVKLLPTTVYVSADGKSAKLSDLAVGERVVIHATPKGDTLFANEIKFSAPGSQIAKKAKQ